MTDYRTAARRCPRCDVVMEVRGTEQVELEACAGCGGVWVDWLDGELVDALPAAGDQPATGTRKADGETWLCPQCRLSLYETTAGSGVPVFRCGQCAGTFVPRSSAQELVNGRADEPDEKDDANTDPWLTKMFDTLRNWLYG